MDLTRARVARRYAASPGALRRRTVLFQYGGPRLGERAGTSVGSVLGRKSVVRAAPSALRGRIGVLLPSTLLDGRAIRLLDGVLGIPDHVKALRPPPAVPLRGSLDTALSIAFTLAIPLLFFGIERRVAIAAAQRT
ncbi:hypothetical protein [Sorangium sp. So ce1097]|uniref:hypothetical protein n=1 Tax=Sorangium sp. So ce1097 TaxID=3133330 RepID=UPI003F630304